MPLIRRRRPVLRAAVAGGAAYHMGKRAARRSEGSQQMEEGPAPEASGRSSSAGMSESDMSHLRELAQLHDQGVLTDEEFEQQKRVYLNGGR